MPHETHYPKVILKPKKEIPILGGHPWVFSGGIFYEGKNTVTSNALNLPPGSLVSVFSSEQKFLGIGTYNPLTNIRVRILTRNANEKINESFFIKKFTKLDEWKRDHLPPHTNGYRLIHAECDGIPGLIADRYADTIVFQIHTAGMELMRDLIISALQKAFSPENIVERSDLEVRKLEGLQTAPISVHQGSITKPIEFQENGFTFFADVLHGQKTGFFLDQRDARAAAGKLAKNKRVLNLFCYTGAFSLYAAKNGASFIASIDTSQPALAQAKENFIANQLDPDDTQHYKFEAHDIFQMAYENSMSDEPYDLIICDPPALAKSSQTTQNAAQAYRDLNQFCISHLPKNGILITSSCSGRITQEDFRDILRIAAGRARRAVRILQWITQPPDHGELLNFPEGRYLKTAVLEVTNEANNSER